jgi:hypothetical protein
MWSGKGLYETCTKFSARTSQKVYGCNGHFSDFYFFELFSFPIPPKSFLRSYYYKPAQLSVSNY